MPPGKAAFHESLLPTCFQQRIEKSAGRPSTLWVKMHGGVIVDITCLATTTGDAGSGAEVQISK